MKPLSASLVFPLTLALGEDGHPRRFRRARQRRTRSRGRRGVEQDRGGFAWQSLTEPCERRGPPTPAGADCILAPDTAALRVGRMECPPWGASQDLGASNTRGATPAAILPEQPSERQCWSILMAQPEFAILLAARLASSPISCAGRPTTSVSTQSRIRHWSRAFPSSPYYSCGPRDGPAHLPRVVGARV